MFNYRHEFLKCCELLMNGDKPDVTLTPKINNILHSEVEVKVEADLANKTARIYLSLSEDTIHSL